MSGRVGGARSAVGAAAAASAAWAQDTTERVSVRSNGAQGNACSGDPALSADGRFVAFASGASNLVAGDTNGVFDVFVRDRQAGTTRRVSVGRGGGQGNGASFEPALSADGRFVAFWSSAANLVPGDNNGVADPLVHDRRTARTERVSLGPRGAQADEVTLGVALSADRRFVAFASQATNLVPGDA
ncbi:MAG: PD40 domain-containing protein, partial [Acetobacteraceae bacterium]|nr:PD40 domain-containing protein [Acetobacteraceae bacterium]